MVSYRVLSENNISEHVDCTVMVSRNLELY